MDRIGDYALIGDCHSAALVGRDGSIDWTCFPRFDSPSVFARILDRTRGGAFVVTAGSVRETRRAYLPDTNVLTTTFECDGGVLELTDCMPVETSAAPGVTAHHAILRRARCTAGSVSVVVDLAPRFEYGSFSPRFTRTTPTSGEIVGGADALDVRATHPIEADHDHMHGSWELTAGEEVWIEISWRHSYGPPTPPSDFPIEAARRLATTVAFWRTWIGRCAYAGARADSVRRSALALKAMTYAPSGAVVAAPTTSLPEEIGGGRNWDYRYTWIRDATLTLTSLFVLGFRDEADAFKAWIERTGAGRAEDLQIMYGIGGERALPELELAHLDGHRDSRPVRIGNGAAKQVQLDAYGQILNAAWLYGKAGGTFTPDNWRFLTGLAGIVCDRWRLPDQGLWEIRDEPRHFTHSKVNCWVALDRAVKLAELRGLPGNIATWRAERDAIRAYLMELAAPDGWFHQAVGHPVPDAATLLVPALGFLPTTHPLSLGTIDAVRRALERDGLVYRYLAPDGLQGGEGAFLLCSFWLVDCLTHAGRLDEAEALLDHLLGFANDVGLFAEEVDQSSGELLGNFPQAFSHMALVLSCAHLDAARRGEIPDGAYDYAELAVDRLLARGR